MPIERHPPQTGIRPLRLAVRSLLIVGVLTAVAFGLFQLERHHPLFAGEPQLTMWVFDVGQGESIFLELPDGTQILVDGGPNDRVLSKLGSVMAPWDRHIDAVFLTHPHADHVSGINEVLETYRVGTVYESGARTHTQAIRRFETLLEVTGTAHRFIASGERMHMGDVMIDVVSPAPVAPGSVPRDPNKTSLVLRIDYGDTEILLTGDATDEEERRFSAHVGDIDVFKVGHSGSITSSTTHFLEETTPEIGLISVGADNDYGHPHPVVLQRLIERNIRVLRTDLDGDILLTSTGGEPIVRPAPLPF